MDLSGDLLRQQPGRLQTLNQISRVLSATLDLRALYDTIYEQVQGVMDASQFFIALYLPDRGAIRVPYQREEGNLILDQEIPFGDNVTSVVIRGAAAFLFHTDEEYGEFAVRHGVSTGLVGSMESHAGIFVPLHTGRQIIGAISVQSDRAHAYTQEDLETLSVIAAQAAVAIENARLYESSQNAVRQMAALLHVAHMVNGSLDLEMVLDSILVGIRQVIPFDMAAILLPDYAHQRLDIVGAIGPPHTEQRREELRSEIKIPFGAGVTGAVFTKGEPLIVPDVRKYPGYVAHGVIGVRSEMAVPLTRGETVIGVLDVERQEPNAFSPDDLRLISLFASQAAIAIENARLYREQQNRVFELQTIQSLVQQLTPLHDIPSIASLINRELNRLIDFTVCAIFTLDAERRELVPVSISDADFPEVDIKLGEGISGWVAQYGSPVIVPNSREDPRAYQVPGTPVESTSLVSAPLVYEGKVRGVITLSKLGIHQFDENALRLLEIVAAQAAIAFDRARLYDELRTEAVTDPMTGLYNRRYLFERFREEQARAVRHPHVLAAIILDIDKFKRVNDRYGHAAGDVVLQELAGVIRQVVRTEDIVARYGGEEFCILLPDIPLRDAEQVAERLRAAIAEHGLPPAAGVERVTASVGMAIVAPGDRETDLFTRADLAMYAVKHRGGNLVCLAEGDSFRFV